MLGNLAAEVWEQLERGDLSAAAQPPREASTPGVRPAVSASVFTANRTELESVMPRSVSTAEQGLAVLSSLVDELLVDYADAARAGISPADGQRPERRSEAERLPVSRPDAQRAGLPAVDSSGQSMREALLPPAAEVARRGAALPPGRASGQPAGDQLPPDHSVVSQLPADPDELAELVNQALVEQALRHGVDLS